MNAVIKRWFEEIGAECNSSIRLMVHDGRYVIYDTDDRSVVVMAMDWDVPLSSDTLEGLTALCQRDLDLYDRLEWMNER